ncbi:hypothetical protein Tco_1278399 [Tanacetum coccineum]
MGLYNKTMWHNVANIPSFVPRAAYVPAGSRNPPASVSAGRSVPAGWRNHAARPMTRPTSHYFQHFRSHSLICSGDPRTMDNPHKNKDLGIVDSGCSRSMTDQEDGREPDVDLDALNALANAAVTVDSTKSPGGPSRNPASCSYDPTSDVPSTDVPSIDVPTTKVPSTEFPTDIPSGVSPTGPSTVSPGSTTIPTRSSVPAAETIPASSATTTATPLLPVRDAQKGKGVAVEEPTPTSAKTFKQLEEERLDAAWDIILARLQANPDLSSIIFRVDFTDDDFATRMVALANSRRKELVTQRAKEWRDRPMTPAQLRQYMRTYVKNQGPAVYSTGWTMAQVRKLSHEQLQEEFDKIQRAVAFTRGLKRDGSPMSSASSKKLKTGDDAVNVEAPSPGVPQEKEGASPSQNVSREEVAAPSHSQGIPNTPVEVPSDIASTAPQTASLLKKVGTKKKRLGRKGVHPSQSIIPIEEGDPKAEL